MKRMLTDELHSTLVERSLQAPGPAATIAAVLARTAALSIEPIGSPDFDAAHRAIDDLDSADLGAGERHSDQPRSRRQRLASSVRRRPLYALVGVAAALAIGNGVVLLQSHHGDDRRSAASSAGAAASGNDLARQAPPAASGPGAGKAPAEALIGIPNCTASALGVSAPAQFQSRPGGGTITIINRGRTECAIRGVASITPELGGQPMSDPFSAPTATASSLVRAPVTPAVVVLAPGASARAQVSVVVPGSNASDGVCVTSDHVRIELPNIAGSVLVPAELPACALRVGPFSP